MKDLEHLENRLEGIRHLLSHLSGEVIALESAYAQVLRVLSDLETAAGTDDLTGLMRRGSFLSKWEEILVECEKHSEQCGVLIVDIDHFKTVNDTHGHPTGDLVIKSISDFLKQFESAHIFTGRIGGEEFAMVIRGSDVEILSTAELIRRGVERLHGPVLTHNGEPQTKVEWRCTVSIGMAGATHTGYKTELLLRAADEALYIAKRKGRNRVEAA